MREFVIYTVLRLVLLVASFAVVSGIWLAFSDSVPLFPAIVISFIVSGVGSYFVLNSQRSRFAAVVERRAARATAAMERARGREDVG